MNVLASECSSGCESGWTLYLEHSFLSADPLHRGNGFVDGEVKRGEQVEEQEEEEEEEEDLSMVSDASSGPPHFQEDEGYYNDDNGCFYPDSMATTLVKNNDKRKKIRTHRGVVVEQEDPSFLDDTASSPLFNFSKNNGFTLDNNQASVESVLDFSQGFSTTHFEGRSAAFRKHLGLFRSSMSGNQRQQNQWYKGKMMGLR